MRWSNTCHTCKHLETEIGYLKELLSQIRADWQAERCEYKRTVDRLLEMAGSRGIGQGETKPIPQKDISITDMMNIFKEKDEIVNAL